MVSEEAWILSKHGLGLQFSMGSFCVLTKILLFCFSSLMIDLVEVEKERLLDEVSVQQVWVKNPYVVYMVL